MNSRIFALKNAVRAIHEDTYGADPQPQNSWTATGASDTPPPAKPSIVKPVLAGAAVTGALSAGAIGAAHMATKKHALANADAVNKSVPLNQYGKPGELKGVVTKTRAERMAGKMNAMYSRAGKGTSQGYRAVTPEMAKQTMLKRGMAGTSKLPGMTAGPGWVKGLGKAGKIGAGVAAAGATFAVGKKVLDMRKAGRQQAQADAEAQANAPKTIRQTQQEDPDVQNVQESYLSPLERSLLGR